MRILSLRCFLMIISMFVIISVNSVNAQSIGFNVGGYYPVNPPSYYDPLFQSEHFPSWEFTSHQKPSISFDVYFRHILDGKNTSRFGIRAHFLSIRSEPIEPNPMEACKYRLSTFLISWQRRLYNEDCFFLMFNLSGGFATKTPGTTTIFGNFAQGSLSFQPGLDFIFRIYRYVGIQVNVRGNFLTASREDFYPYSSGIIFEGGILFELPKGK